MLQIPRKMSGGWEVRTPESCNTVEMAASSAKIMQIAGKTDRTDSNKKQKQNGKKIIPKTIPHPHQKVD